MYQEPIESCAKRIRKALSIRNMTQSELCRRTKIATSAMSEYIKDFTILNKIRYILWLRH